MVSAAQPYDAGYEFRHLFWLARDLFQVCNEQDALALVGKALCDLLQMDGGILITQSDGGVELAVAFGNDGKCLALDREAPAYQCASRTLSQNTVPFDACTLLPASVVAPFPESGPIGILLAYWNLTLEDQEIAAHIRTLRYVAELTGAALGNLCTRSTLEQKVAHQRECISTAAQEFSSEIARRDQSERRVQNLSMTDVMTGLLNRRGFFLWAEEAFSEAKLKFAKSVVVFGDVDNLKLINDGFGHETGDQLLRDCAQVFSSVFQRTDVVARLGGDEFVAFVICEDDPPSILRKIDEEITNFNLAKERHFEVSISVGIVQCDPSSGTSLSDYLSLADKEMYGYKRGRRMRISQN
jgi:diguanylate cyclase (GGDEF)-like protein